MTCYDPLADAAVHEADHPGRRRRRRADELVGRVHPRVGVPVEHAALDRVSQQVLPLLARNGVEPVQLLASLAQRPVLVVSSLDLFHEDVVVARGNSLPGESLLVLGQAPEVLGPVAVELSESVAQEGEAAAFVQCQLPEDPAEVPKYAEVVELVVHRRKPWPAQRGFRVFVAAKTSSVVSNISVVCGKVSGGPPTIVTVMARIFERLYIHFD